MELARFLVRRGLRETEKYGQERVAVLSTAGLAWERAFCGKERTRNQVNHQSKEADMVRVILRDGTVRTYNRGNVVNVWHSLLLVQTRSTDGGTVAGFARDVMIGFEYERPCSVRRLRKKSKLALD